MHVALAFIAVAVADHTLVAGRAMAQQIEAPTATKQMLNARRFNLFESLGDRGVASGTLREMRALGINLFFLVQRGSEGQMFIVRTSLGGRVQVAIGLGASDVNDWFVDNDLSITVDLESLDGKLRELRRYNAGGEQVHASDVRVDGYGTAVLRDAPARVTRSGAIVRREFDRLVTIGYLPLNHLNRFDTTCLTLPEQRAAIVDQVDATVAIVDLKTGRSELKPLSHREVARARSRFPARSDGTNVLLIQAASSDADGNLYCMLTGFRPVEGAPVLVLDHHADVRRLLRCPILSGQSGMMVPEAIAVTSQELFVAAQSGDVASFYLAPTQ
jgi:hypothetical protein